MFVMCTGHVPYDVTPSPGHSGYGRLTDSQPLVPYNEGLLYIGNLIW
jgi:hypothetical protein